MTVFGNLNKNILFDLYISEVLIKNNTKLYLHEYWFLAILKIQITTTELNRDFYIFCIRCGGLTYNLQY